MVEKQPDPDAFKRVCSHFIQASGGADDRTARPARADHRGRRRALADPGLDRWGWIEAAARGGQPRRSTCAARCSTRWCARRRRRPPASSSMLGQTATGLLRDGDAVAGVTRARPRRRRDRRCARKLVVGADGRDSQVAELAGVKEKILPHERFAYGGYFEGAMPEYAPDSAIWFAGPALGGRLPHRQRARLLRGDADQGTAARVQARPEPRRWSPSSPGCPDGAADPRRRAWSNRCSASSRCRTGCAPRSPPAWRWSATRRWPPTRCSGSAAAGPSSRANGSPTRSRRRCTARSRWSAA